MASAGGGESKESVGQYTTLKTALGSAQPIRTSKGNDAAKDSENLAASIAQRKAGDPSAFERSPVDGHQHDDNNEKERKRDNERFKKPWIVSGIIVAVVGAVIALLFNKSSKNEHPPLELEPHVES